MVKSVVVFFTWTKLFVIKCWYFCRVFSSETNCMTVTSSTTMPHFGAGQQIDSEWPSSVILIVKYWRQQSLQYSCSQPRPMISFDIETSFVEYCIEYQFIRQEIICFMRDLMLAFRIKAKICKSFNVYNRFENKYNKRFLMNINIQTLIWTTLWNHCACSIDKEQMIHNNNDNCVTQTHTQWMCRIDTHILRKFRETNGTCEFFSGCSFARFLCEWILNVCYFEKFVPIHSCESIQ